MPGIMASGNFGKLLAPGINEIYGMMYKRREKQYPHIFEVLPSSRAFEEDQQVVGIGMAPVIQEGQPLQYQTMAQGYNKRYTHVEYGTGFIITKNMYDDNQYPSFMRQATQQVALSMQETIETIAANQLNRGFNSSYTGADGVELFSTVHPNGGGAGGTFSNTADPATAISELALEDAWRDVNNYTNDAGMHVPIKIKSLVVPVDLFITAHKILDSVLQNNTTNNAVNVLRSEQLIPDGIWANNFLTRSTAYFLLTDCPAGLRMFMRTPPPENNLDRDSEFDTKNMKAQARMRFSVGWTDPRGAWASLGV